MRSRRTIAVLAFAIPAFAAVAVLLPHTPSELRDLVAGVGPAAPAVAVAAWIVLVPAMFPGTVLAAAGGLAFGALGGSVLAVVGAVAGGLVAFAVARFGAREAVERLAERRPRLARIQELLERRGFVAVLAGRLLPGVPVGGLHYLAGASPVRARSFAAALTAGALLRTVPYVFVGQGLGSGSIAGIVVAVGSIVLGGVAAAVLVRRLVPDQRRWTGLESSQSRPRTRASTR